MLQRLRRLQNASDFSKTINSNKLSHYSESPHPGRSPLAMETSNFSWAELESYVIGNVQIFPLTTYTRQILILRYLTRMGAYQDVSCIQIY